MTATAAVFLLLAVTFSCPASTMPETTQLVKGGGWFGLAMAAAAWYPSFAAVVSSTLGRIVMPVRPLT